MENESPVQEIYHSRGSSSVDAGWISVYGPLFPSFAVDVQFRLQLLFDFLYFQLLPLSYYSFSFAFPHANGPIVFRLCRKTEWVQLGTTSACSSGQTNNQPAAVAPLALHALEQFRALLANCKLWCGTRSGRRRLRSADDVLLPHHRQIISNHYHYTRRRTIELDQKFIGVQVVNGGHNGNGISWCGLLWRVLKPQCPIMQVIRCFSATNRRYSEISTTLFHLLSGVCSRTRGQATTLLRNKLFL